MRQISILGCGWLGLPLAQALIENGFSLKGSTTSESKIQLLEKSGAKPYIISLKAENIQGNISAFLMDSEILIIDIPPKLRGAEKENFVAKIERLMPYIEQSSVKKVLFVSSTSVYADDNSTITEATLPKPETESGKQLLASEVLLQKNSHFNTSILRFGGLIGDDRHPVKFLAGRNNIENPEAPINLIHQEDCIGIIISLITHDVWSQTFNAVAPFHPSRKTYYTSKAVTLGLDPPTFKDELSTGKIIDSSKLMSTLNYSFTHRETL